MSSSEAETMSQSLLLPEHVGPGTKVVLTPPGEEKRQSQSEESHHTIPTRGSQENGEPASRWRCLSSSQGLLSHLCLPLHLTLKIIEIRAFSSIILRIKQLLQLPLLIQMLFLSTFLLSWVSFFLNVFFCVFNLKFPE